MENIQTFNSFQPKEIKINEQDKEIDVECDESEREEEEEEDEKILLILYYYDDVCNKEKQVNIKVAKQSLWRDYLKQIVDMISSSDSGIDTNNLLILRKSEYNNDVCSYNGLATIKELGLKENDKFKLVVNKTKGYFPWTITAIIAMNELGKNWPVCNPKDEDADPRLICIVYQ